MIFAGLDDELGLAWTEFAYLVHGWMSCRVAMAAQAAIRGEAHARAAGDEILARTLRGWVARTLTAGPAPVEEAMRVTESMLAEATGLASRAGFRRNIGMLLAMQGQIDEARRQLRLGIEGTREAGQPVEAAALGMTAAFVEFRAGAYEAAEVALRDGIEELDRLGNASYRGTAALLLADHLANRGAYEESARWSAEVRATLNADDLSDVVLIDAVEGFLAAASGRLAEGERRSTCAVEAAAAIDLYDFKGRAYEWHARTLALAGKQIEAREAATAALAIYEAKGDLPASAWARELLDSLSA